jgi:two-component system KDP operon response regulator KdpE
MTQEARILLVDDEVSIQRAVEPLLRSRGYQVDVAATGTQALKMLAERSPDLIVLDLGLPDIEGTEVCRRVRATSRVPIVVLSARGAEADKVNALDLGADDYVTKPFGPEELLARIRVALRRVMSEDEAETGVFRAGDLIIDYDRRRVLRDETEIRLTPKEFELLSLLARNHDRVPSSRRSGGRTPSNRPSTCGRWSRRSARRSNRIPGSRSTSSVNPGSGTGSPRVTREPDSHPPLPRSRLKVKVCARRGANVSSLQSSGTLQALFGPSSVGTSYAVSLGRRHGASQDFLGHFLARSQASVPIVELRKSR